MSVVGSGWRTVIRLAIILLMSLNLRGQIPVFEHLTSADGLSQMFISSIYQDHQGFIWFGTKDGLNRYDGMHVRIYHFNPSNQPSVSGIRITTIFEDSHYRLWIGSFDRGILLFDRETEQFIPSVSTDPHLAWTSTSRINAITEAPDGTVWLATAAHGLLILSTIPSRPGSRTEADKNTIDWGRHRFGVVQLQPARDVLPISDDINVNCLLPDRQGSMWLGTSRYLYRIRPRDRPDPHTAPNRLDDPASWHSKGPEWLVNRFSDHGHQGVGCLALDYRNRLWLGTPNGLFRFDPATRKLILPIDPVPERVSRLGGIRSILACPPSPGHPDGQLWLGCYAGLAIYDPARKHYAIFKYQPDNPRSISHGSILSLCRDRGGVIWLGTNGNGVNKFDPQSIRFTNPDFPLENPSDIQRTIRDLSVRSIFESGKEEHRTLWIGSDGLYRIQPPNGRLHRIHLERLCGQDPGIVYNIHQDQSGLIWAGTGQGLLEYDPHRQTATLYRPDLATPDGPSDERVFKIIRDTHDQIWVITARTISMFDPRHHRFTHHYYDSRPADRFEEPVFPALYQARDDCWWLGCHQGLLRFNPLDGRFTPVVPISENSGKLPAFGVLSIRPDPQNPDRFLWLGTSGSGLLRIDPHRGDVRKLTMDDGLPSNYIYGILSDAHGRFWLSTNRGICRFTPTSDECRNYDVSDGLQSDEFNAGAYFMNPDGEMFFGGIRGINFFDPNSIHENTFEPNIVLIDLLVNNESRFVPPKSQQMTIPGSPIGTIRLNYQEKLIAFEFIALSFSNPARNLYAYRMENLNDQWISNGTHRRVTFTNLSPGEYVFHVKGSNSDGIWNEKGTAVRLIIAPPPWNTWWAYMMYIIAASAVLYGVRHYELNRISLKYHLELLREDIRLATQIQQNLLPREIPKMNHYEIYGHSVPTRPIGGDYYDFIRLNDKELAICVGDVSGKGLSAALLMANLQAIIRNQARQKRSAQDCLLRSNQLLIENIECGKFVTLFYGILDECGHRLSYCNAGHNNPLLFNGAPEPEELDTGGIVLGFLENAQFEQTCVSMEPGSRLVIYSDGITEATNVQG